MLAPHIVAALCASVSVAEYRRSKFDTDPDLFMLACIFGAAAVLIEVVCCFA